MSAAARRAARAGAPLLCAALVAILAPAAGAQDFPLAGEAGPAGGAAGMLDTALPQRLGAPVADALAIGRYALPELATRALAAGFGIRSLRAALGVSQTGAADLGWNAAACAAGVAHARWGAGVRALARRDRSPAAAPPGFGAGAECGAGAWADLGGPVTVWASAPQMWLWGAAPPLHRGFATGICVHGGEARAWFEHEARPEAAAAVSHRAGVGLGEGPLGIWVEGADGPLRAAVGVVATLPRLRLSAAMESHPVLGESARLGLHLGRARDAWRQPGRPR